ncbi:MAG: THUMP domain-containing protein, partial [Planctomycetota bacterium]
MNSTERPTIALLATTAFGLEAVVSRELKQLGYDSQTVQPGRVEALADLDAICRLNLNLRCAERILVRIGEFPADDFGKLFDGTAALPWEQWIPADGQFPVRGRSIKSQLSSVPACQRMVKKAIATRLADGHGVAELVETGAEYRVEVALLKDQVTLTLDTTGDGLHKRGYRPIAGKAALRETLAAALVLLSYWRRDRPLIDPFCGTGTIPIEAAMIGRNIAPGLKRSFVSESWPMISAKAWETERAAARESILPSLPIRIRASDTHEGALGLARRNAAAAGVEEDIHFQAKAFADVTSKKQYGCIITNPPYGQRMGSKTEIYDLYRSFPTVLRNFPTWSHYVITSFEDFEKVIGQKANRRRKLYNGRIECQYYQFHGPRPPKKHDNETTQPTSEQADAVAEDSPAPVDANTLADDAAASQPTENRPREIAGPAFGGLKEEASRQAEEFGNRLRKRARHLRRWPKRGITCYRLYERDIPEIPLVVDRYEDCLHIAEFARPHERTPAQHQDWLDLMAKTAAEVLEVAAKNVFVKFRDRQRGASQYQRNETTASTFVVNEGGLKFKVNLSDY